MADLSGVVERVMSKYSSGVPLERAVADIAINEKLSADDVRALLYSINKIRVWSGLNKEASPEIRPIKVMSVVNEIKNITQNSELLNNLFSKDAQGFITDNEQNFIVPPDAVKKFLGQKEAEHRALQRRIVMSKAADEVKWLVHNKKRKVNELKEAMREFRDMVSVRVRSDKTASALASIIKQTCGDISNDVLKIANQALAFGVKIGTPTLGGEYINWNDPLPLQIKLIAERYAAIKEIDKKINTIQEGLNAGKS
jgi:hypothetical protein